MSKGINEEDFCFKHNKHYGVLKDSCGGCHLERLEQENKKLNEEVERYLRSLGVAQEQAIKNGQRALELKELVKEAIEYLPRSNVEINCDCKCPTCMWLEKARQAVGEE